MYMTVHALKETCGACCIPGGLGSCEREVPAKLMSGCIPKQRFACMLPACGAAVSPHSMCKYVNTLEQACDDCPAMHCIKLCHCLPVHIYVLRGLFNSCGSAWL